MSLNQLRAHELSLTQTKGQVPWEHILWNTPRGVEESEEKGNYFILVFRERALQRSQRIGQKQSRGDGRCPLAGIPVAREDIIGVKVGRAACGFGILENFISPCGDLVIPHLKEWGSDHSE
jgi:Asp-tRNA(Asn)/Glu-tRNA(Gln) amidotransferase A subunit family amidase